ncbi:ArnT family glycosyltransferase [Occallatibacter riparius]|uniref:Glycosyltransferase family 39 protein n=1 Tax=Occallatibacter riparius TaxID=1002689 RepID=A0A9J7BUF7_9BACT|nr:phospholipid carrier-dependent glycosyltransferase [Occallatibacter riparius]UWZ86507.1 glycosyltransferase family 39 protein [Occallatibacter riparius]
MRQTSYKRWAYAAWLVLIIAFAVSHYIHLEADFPNHSPWIEDWAKYTDEGWYGNAAVRAHLTGHWYVPGDFNPAPAVPVWPFLEWIVFAFTGVNIVAARSLSVSFFVLELILGYLLLRTRGPRWMALLAVTLAVTSPFLYAFSRLAILEPMLVTFLLAGLNLAVRLPRFRRPVLVSIVIGVLFTLMLLTKTTAVFLFPALGWAILAALWPDRRKAVICSVAAAASAALSFGAWMALIIHAGVLRDYRYLFFINKYIKPTEWYWPLLSLWWSIKGGLWADHILIPLAGIVVLLVLALALRRGASRRLWADPVFGAPVLALAGYILFMTYQNHPQPRYYVVVALFAFFVIALGAEALVTSGAGIKKTPPGSVLKGHDFSRAEKPLQMAGLQPLREGWPRLAGITIVAATALATAFNALSTAQYLAHPEYTFVNAARNLTRYIDQHPNGNRLLVSISADEISMITHLPSLCDDFGTQDLSDKLPVYQPGWWATWNDIDPGTLEDLHIHYSLEQVAVFAAMDHSERNQLVLFKLHPLSPGEKREYSPDLQVPLPGDKIEIPYD